MKKILLTLLSFIIYFNSITGAHAGTIGGWTYSNPISKGASAVISASKNVVINGKDFIKTGTATITPTAAQVAKTFGKTAGALALTVAIEQILGTVDWVLDPENNQITYSKQPSNDVNSPTVQYYYQGEGQKAVKPLDAALLAAKSNQFICGKNATCTVYKQPDAPASTTDYYYCVIKNSEPPSCGYIVSRYTNPYYDPTATDDTQPKSLPLSNLATRVIDNANTGEPKAQAAILQAATDILAEAETDSTKARPITNQLEQSSETKPADAVDALKQNTATGKTTNPDGSVAESEFEMPVACTWMPLVCQAASVVITKPGEWAQDIKSAYDDAVDFFKSEPQDTQETQVQFPEEEPPLLDTGIFKASGECPPDFTYSFPLPFGGSHTISYSYATVCYWFSKLYYIVVTVASIISIRIASGTEGKSNG
ncbi:hypothetical protein ACNJ69_17985 [Acinetobacter soli]|uniref:hypothetical protein n=1 Tax=Acinetobacter soli TaxID=487316 RepID=UPI001F1BB987|nr:hypothetical protein [Acinetobacter soli]MCE6006657.1 hypothetical protein [Acinetobacter soli]